MTDLDELKKLLAAATPGEWEVAHSDPACVWTYLDHLMICGQAIDAALIVALHNAAPAIIAELEAARAVCEVITLWAGVEMTTLHPDIAKALRNWKKARGEG